MKRVLAIFLAICLTMALFCGCGAKKPAQDAAGTEPTVTEPKDDASDTENETRTIIDHAGNEVEIPVDIQRVVITSVTPLPALFCLFMGSADKLVGMYPASKNTAMNTIVADLIPGIADVSTSFYDGSEINIEELIKLDPDVVFYFAGKEEEKEAIEKAGIPAVAFDPFYDGNNGSSSNNIVEVTREWISFLSEIFNMPDRSADFESSEKSIDELVSGRISTISDEDKPTTLILANYNESAIMAGGTQTADYWIAAGGGINVASELGTAMAQVNMEQIYQWDPDIIILNSFSAYTVDDIQNSTAADGHDWSGLTAVQNGRVYKIPLGTYYWYATCYDSPLMTLWIAKTLNPDAFTDIDFDSYLTSYFKDAFGIELTEEEITQIYNPIPESHM